jgi:hypothetical protein
MRIDVETVQEIHRQLEEINSHKMNDIEWFENGVKLNITPEILEDWRFVGMSNESFVALKFWLRNTDKKPYSLNGRHYWCCEEDAGVDYAEDADMLLSKVLFDALDSPTTYPNCKMYNSEQEALSDLYQALEKTGQS